MDKQPRRGRISSIDLLPEEAWPFVKQAIADLAARKREAESIREELNTHLLALGLNPISASAFNRKSLALAKVGANIARAREVAAVFAEKLDEMPEGDVGMLINEMLKVIAYDMTEKIAAEDMEVGAKILREISLTLLRLEQSGQVSAKRRGAIEERAREKATAVVDTVAREKGLSTAVVEDIKAKILGIKTE